MLDTANKTENGLVLLDSASHLVGLACATSHKAFYATNEFRA